MVEAGPRLVSSFVKEGQVDKLYYFIAPSLIGGSNSAFKDIGVDNIIDKKNLRLFSSEIIDGDVLLTYYFT
jgi:diaminohydroxyphosphoribosylaminopyrimidine deaminase/5-amino-6-(5-phosphoribosylamino)uracil reductase